jgi:hypothetical protein
MSSMLKHDTTDESLRNITEHRIIYVFTHVHVGVDDMWVWMDLCMGGGVIGCVSERIRVCGVCAWEWILAI